jgi:hypothetical protein
VPAVLLDPPVGWRPAAIPAPPIAESAGARLASYAAVASPDSAAALVTGCVATPIPGWVEDMRPSIEGRTAALAGAVAERITGAPVDGRPDGEGRLLLRSASDLAGPVLGGARTFVGFDEHHVLTCFATCASRDPRAASTWHGCEGSLAGARLDGARPPPAPGLLLGAATWAVHHPRDVALGVAVIAVGLAILAIVTRRRPRFRH